MASYFANTDHMLLWRLANRATLDSLRGKSKGQYDIRLTRPAGIDAFVAGLPRLVTDLDGFNVQLPISAADAPKPVPPTSLTISFMGPRSERKDWRIPSQRPKSAYELWRPGVGVQPDTKPDEDYVVIVRTNLSEFHARWLQRSGVNQLPEAIREVLVSKNAGVLPFSETLWPQVARILSLPDHSADRREVMRDSSSGPCGVPYREEQVLHSAKQPDPFQFDPDVLDRGVNAHRETQNAVAKFLRKNGLAPLSHRPRIDPPFDLAWRVNELLFVAEIKSLTKANEERQLRLGVGQVLRYAHLLSSGSGNVRPVLISEHEPSDPTWQSFCESIDVHLAWPGSLDSMLSL